MTFIEQLLADFTTANAFVGKTIGEAQQVLPIIDTLIAPVAPEVAAALPAGVTALGALNTTVQNLLSGPIINTSEVGSAVASLSSAAMGVAVQVAPFISATANATSAVNHAALQVAKIAATTASAAAAVSAATAPAAAPST